QLAKCPYPLHRLHDCGKHGTLDTHREVGARRRLTRRVVVVDNVDATDKSHLAVDVAELAVKTAQAMRTEMPQRDLGSIFEQVDARVGHFAFERSGHVILRAPGV